MVFNLITLHINSMYDYQILHKHNLIESKSNLLLFLHTYGIYGYCAWNKNARLDSSRRCHGLILKTLNSVRVHERDRKR